MWNLRTYVFGTGTFTYNDWARNKNNGRGIEQKWVIESVDYWERLGSKNNDWRYVVNGTKGIIIWKRASFGIN